MTLPHRTFARAKVIVFNHSTKENSLCTIR